MKYYRCSRISIIVFLALGLVACGPKFEPFSSPRVAVAFSPDAEFQVLADTKAPPTVVGTIKGKEAIKALGLAHTKIQDSKMTFLKIECPPQLNCKDGTGYLHRDQFTRESLPKEFSLEEYKGMQNEAVVLPADEAASALAVRDWLLNPITVPPTLKLEYVVGTFLARKDVPTRIQMLYELHLFLKAFDEPAQHGFKDPRLTPLLAKYRPLAKLKQIFVDQEGRNWETSPLSQWKRHTGLLAEIEETLKEFEIKALAGFPLRATSWQGLAQAFNRENLPYMRERIFEKSLEKPRYKVESDCVEDCSPALAYTVVILPAKGAYLKVADQLRSIQSIKATAGEHGLIFTLTLDDETISFEPAETPPYLSIGGPGLQQQIASFPNKWQDILKLGGFNRPALVMAMKFGKGGYDAQSGLMKYTLPKTMYWPFFELFRQSPNVEKTGQGFTGTVKGFECAGYETVSMGYAYSEDCSWIQPKGYLKLRYRGCYGSEVEQCDPIKEVVCAYDDSNVAEISFHPDQIREDEPAVKIKSLAAGVNDTEPELCSAFLQAAVTGPKN